MKVSLKKWEDNDFASLAKICNDVDRTYLTGRLPYPYTDDDARWWLDMISKHEGKDGIYRAILVDEKIVGNISIEQKQDVFVKDAELGYMLDKSYWGKGIMSMAVSQICKLAFAELDIVRISAELFVGNIASAKVLVKNGFCLEGVRKSAIWKNEQFYDLQMYGLLKKVVE